MAAKRTGGRRVPLMPAAAASLLVLLIVRGFAPPVETLALWAASTADRLAVAAGLGIRQISIAGLERTAGDSVFAALDFGTQGSEPRAFPAPAALARLESLPWVARVQVRRFFPDILHIEIAERTPFALWEHGGSTDVIDATGRILAPAAAHPDLIAAGLPRLKGEGANLAAAHILETLSAFPSIETRLQVLEREGGRRWTLHLAGGVRVHLPPANERTALEGLGSNAPATASLDTPGSVIDLRSPRWITVRAEGPRTLRTAAASAGS